MKLRDRFSALWGWRPEIGIEALTLIVCVYLVVTCNGAFWTAALSAGSGANGDRIRLLLGTGIALCALHFVLLVCLSGRWTVKPVLGVVVVISAMAAYYQDHYAVYLDPDMVSNVLHTEYEEARELISPTFIGMTLLRALPPLLLIWRVRLLPRNWRRASWIRALSVIAAIALCATGTLLAFRDLSSLMRNHREVRYLITPANFVYAGLRVVVRDASQSQRPLRVIGEDARVERGAGEHAPRLLILIVGETVRAQNWGLSGYARDTTPQLRTFDVINYTDAHSCGTATEVSLPCMFAPVGRRDYDEGRIRGQQSLLHVLDHAGIASLWRDNQTGCKGVCAGLPERRMDRKVVDAYCDGDACFDEALLQDLQRDIDAATGDLVVVLHPIGNHGPSYFARYPDRFRQFMPTCESAELSGCSQEELVNSYDNAVLYADHIAAEAIRLLQRQKGRDTALIYVSDHGESLGEHGLYLHGIPYPIAPVEQTSVPLLMWISDTFAASAGIDRACLRERSGARSGHDNLFHSVLGLFDVRTRIYEPTLDLLRPCRVSPQPTVASR